MHEHLWKPFAGALTRTRSGVAAPACAPVRARRAECASRKKSPTPIGAVFVITAQALELLQENPCGYGVRVSGATIYSYVEGDLVSLIDPTGLQSAWAWNVITGGMNPTINIPRADYIQVGYSGPFWGAGVTIDRNLNIYVGVNTGCIACAPSPQVCFGRANGTPMTPDELRDFISGAGGQATAGQYGVGYGWAFSGGRSASQITFGGPQLPGGGSGGYTWQVRDSGIKK
jgi:hypothetical protein